MLNERITSKLLNVAIISAKVKELNTPFKKIRPQMHMLIAGAPGLGKSSILYQISSNIGKSPMVSPSVASIYGSVDKNTGELISPTIWDCRNSCVLVDEFSIKTRAELNFTNQLLPLLEFSLIEKKIGYRCSNVDEKDDDLYLKVEKNIIRCKTRFTFIATTMMNFRKKLIEDVAIFALASRCLIIDYDPSLETIIAQINGQASFIYEQIDIPDKLNIDEVTSKRILNCLDERSISKHNYMRSYGDLCRIVAIIGWDDELIDYILTQKNRFDHVYL